MKKLTFVSLIALLFAVSSCKKSSSSNGIGTFSASIDGTSASFATAANAVQSNLGGATEIEMEGAQGAISASATILSIDLSSAGAITEGMTFSDTSTVGNTAFIDYGSTTNNYSSGTAKVTVTGISATSIQGTFSGEVDGGTSPASHTITNGTFNLKLTNQ